jgi:competence ComEA-like helix-hairpin-helix protein
MSQPSRFQTISALSFLLLSTSPTKAQDLPAGAAKEILQKSCTECHTLEAIPHLKYTKEKWQTLVYSMVDMGAEVSAAQIDVVVDYLAKNFGPDQASSGKINPNKASAQEMEEALALTTKEAEGIVLYRMKHGDFKDTAELLKVEGVDPKKIEASSERLDFTPTR